MLQKQTFTLVLSIALSLPAASIAFADKTPLISAFDYCMEWAYTGKQQVFPGDWEAVLANAEFNNSRVSFYLNRESPYVIATTVRSSGDRVCKVSPADTAETTLTWANGAVDVGEYWRDAQFIDNVEIQQQLRMMNLDLQEDPNVHSLVRSEESGTEIFLVCSSTDSRMLSISPAQGTPLGWELSATWRDEPPTGPAVENCP